MIARTNGAGHAVVGVATMLIAAATPAVALEWPLAPVELGAGFGDVRSAVALDGVLLAGAGQPVRAVAAGEVVFMRSAGAYSSVPSGLGTSLIIEHAGGLRSHYGHLDDRSVDAARERYAAGEVLGVVGESGNNQRGQLYLAIRDSAAGRMVNPLSVLPALTDTRPPSIRGLALLAAAPSGQSAGQAEIRLTGRGDGATDNSEAATPAVPPGSYYLLVDAYDLHGAVRFTRLAPHRVEVFVAGRATDAVVLDSFSAVDGRWTASDDDTPLGERLLADGRWRLGPLTLRSGEQHVTTVVSDFSGNRTALDIFFAVADQPTTP